MIQPVKIPRIALFVEWHEGFGHFNIVSQLARQLDQLNNEQFKKEFGVDIKQAEVMVLCGTLDKGGARKKFNFGKTTQIVDLPPVTCEFVGGVPRYLTQTGQSSADKIKESGSRDLSPLKNQPYAFFSGTPKYIDRRKQAVRTAIERFQPDLVLTELFPFEQRYRQHDMEAIAELKREGKVHCDTVALCRDIMHNDHPQEVIGWIKKYITKIFMRGDKNFIELKESQPEWADIPVPIEYMGNFVNSMPARSLDIPDEDRHVAIFGGGGYIPDDLAFFENIIRARAHSKECGRRVWDIYISENASQHYVPDPANPEGPPLTVRAYLEDMAQQESGGMIRIHDTQPTEKFNQLLVDAALAITRSSYNATFELYSVKQHILSIPRDTEEQTLRANTLGKHGMAITYPYPVPLTNAQPTIEAALKDVPALAENVDLAARTKPRQVTLDSHGTENTANALLAMVYKKYELEQGGAENTADSLRVTENQQENHQLREGGTRQWLATESMRRELAAGTASRG